MIISTRKLVSGYFNGKGWSEGSKSKRFTLGPCTFTHLIQNTLIKKQNGRIRRSKTAPRYLYQKCTVFWN